MLIYHPAFDVNHAMLRFARILATVSDPAMPWDKLRILDFYYLFPHLLKDVPVPSATSLKRYFAQRASRYNSMPAPRMFLRQIEGLQELAIRSLASKGFVEQSALEQGVISKTDQPFPPELLDAETGELPDNSKLLELLRKVASIPLTGPNGLKARSGLLEHRYDPD